MLVSFQGFVSDVATFVVIFSAQLLDELHVFGLEPIPIFFGTFARGMGSTHFCFFGCRD